MKFYLKQPIEAEQFDGSERIVDKYGIRLMPRVTKAGHVDTLEGTMLIHLGDWIATDIDGERWLIADAIFKQTYAELPVIPKEVAGYLEIVRQEETLFGVLDEALAGVSDLSLWIAENQDDFARAWINGYTVEADK